MAVSLDKKSTEIPPPLPRGSPLGMERTAPEGKTEEWRKCL